VARDSSPYVRQAVVAKWKAHAPLLALVSAGSIYPPQRPPNPPWPFVAYGVPQVEPFGASCLDGCTVSFAGHAYAETGGAGVDTVQGEQLAGEIAQRMVDALDAPLDLAALADCPYPATAFVTWSRTQVIQDDSEADRFHAIVSFDVTVSS
jgi:hypothetical protein